jgi:hypothetical protein
MRDMKGGYESTQCGRSTVRSIAHVIHSFVLDVSSDGVSRFGPDTRLYTSHSCFRSPSDLIAMMC